MRYYKTHLTRRLILETSADSEKEEAMVEWLREVGMPAEYINKLARMFQDIKVSEDLNRQFKDQHKDSAMSGKSTRGLFCQLVHFCYNCTDILFQLYRYPQHKGTELGILGQELRKGPSVVAMGTR